MEMMTRRFDDDESEFEDDFDGEYYDLPVNIGRSERMASVIAGGALIVYGLMRRRWMGLALATGGGLLVARAITGHSLAYALTGLSTADDPHSTAELIVGPDGILVERTVTIQR